MHLTDAQLATLKTAINADPALAALPKTPDDAATIADAFNTSASPAFVVWKTSARTQELMSDGFVWTEIDGLTVGKARIWDWMSRAGTINPSRQGVRQGLADCFGASSQTANSLQPLLKRPATRGEALFAAGTGSTLSPATMTFAEKIDREDVEKARNLP